MDCLWPTFNITCEETSNWIYWKISIFYRSLRSRMVSWNGKRANKTCYLIGIIIWNKLITNKSFFRAHRSEWNSNWLNWIYVYMHRPIYAICRRPNALTWSKIEHMQWANDWKKMQTANSRCFLLSHAHRPLSDTHCVCMIFTMFFPVEGFIPPNEWNFHSILVA